MHDADVTKYLSDDELALWDELEGLVPELLEVRVRAVMRELAAAREVLAGGEPALERRARRKAERRDARRGIAPRGASIGERRPTMDHALRQR